MGFFSGSVTRTSVATLMICLVGSLAAGPSLAQEAAPESPPMGAPPVPTEDTGIQIPVNAVPTEFASELAPYGRWISLPHWGWVWQPNPSVIGSDFRPYVTGGQWVSTPDGWVFDTNSPWAVTFHYGRWFEEPGYGWVWLPGTVWGPSWVDWRLGNGFVGWAPLAPPGFVFTNEFQPWAFCDVVFFGSPSFFTHVVFLDVVHVRRIFVTTVPVRNVVVLKDGVRWNAGPHPQVLTGMGAHVQTTPSVRPQQMRPTTQHVEPMPQAPAGRQALPHAGVAPPPSMHHK